jgi:hypothetical protein
MISYPGIIMSDEVTKVSCDMIFVFVELVDGLAWRRREISTQGFSTNEDEFAEANGRGSYL